MSSRSPSPSRPILMGFVALGLALFFGAASGSASDPMAVLKQAIAEAEQGLQQGESQIAESRYRTVLLEGWLVLGALAFEEGDLDAAKDAYEHAAVAATEVRRPHMSLALVELRRGEAAPAVSLLRGLLAHDLSDLAVRRLLPRALMAADQVGEAIQEMKELQVLSPEDLENTYALARAHLGQGRPEAAAALFAELAERRPIAETHVLIGRTYRDFDHYQAAREQLETAISLDPRVERAHYYLGTVDLYDQGQDLLDSAIDHFEAELRVAPEDPMANLYLGIGLVEKRRFEEALPRLEAAIRLVAERPDAFQFLGRSYLALGRVEEAIATLRRGLEISRTQTDMAPSRGPVDARRRQQSSLHFQLAQALRQSGDEAAAASHFDAAKELSARSAEGARDLLQAYFRDDQGEAGLAASTWPLELSPISGFSPEQRAAVETMARRSVTQAYFNLGVQQTGAGHHARGAALYREAADLDPDFPRVHYALGAALFNSEQFVAAAAALELAMERRPDDEPEDPTLSRMLALAWLNSESYDRAADLLRGDPERGANRSLQYAYAVALVRGGRVGEAEPIFDQLLTENADWPELNVLLGQAHAQQDDYDAAIGYLERALQLSPEVGEARSTLGDIYLRQGKLTEAEAELRAELNAHPADWRARYKLAVVLDLNRNSEEAHDLLVELLDSRPDLADGRYLLGKILLARGETVDALAQLEAAAALSPKDANIHYQLSQAYQRAGRAEAAARAIAEYRRLKQAGGQRHEGDQGVQP